MGEYNNKYLDSSGVSFLWEKVKEIFIQNTDFQAALDEKQNLIKYDTTSGWNSKIGFIPAEGEIIVYTDKSVIQKDGQNISIPGIKVGDGKAYCVDLPFVGDEYSLALLNHINDTTKHITPEDRTKWDNKLNYNVTGEELIFNKN